MRNIVVMTLCIWMAACRSHSAADDSGNEVYQAQISTTLEAAYTCERGYVHAQMQSQAAISEIADAAVATCEQPIAAAVQAYMADVVVRRENTLTAAEVAHERARARAAISRKLRGDATQLLAEGRTPARKPP